MAFLPVFQPQRSVKVYKARRTNLAKDYISLYRFDEKNVQWLADHFLKEKFETRGGALSSKQKMQIFLRYVADPGFQKGIGEELGVDQTTVCKVVKQVRLAIVAKAHLWIKLPSSATDVLQAKQEWENRFKMPCIIGAIDCTHVRISKPKENGDEYINRKRYASINVQATCNATEKFTSVGAEWPGSVHDSGIFKNWDICRVMKTRMEDTALLGDSGYGIAPWLVTPYDVPRSDTEAVFNSVYAKERVIIERCFGQVKKRFPTLHYKVRVALPSVSGIIISCFVLHNAAKYLNDGDDFPNLLEDAAEVQNANYQNIDESDNVVGARGQAFRQRIADTLFLNR